MIKKIKHFFKEQSEFKPYFKEIAEIYSIPAFMLSLDSLYCRFRYGSPTAQYIGFQFYKMNRLERNKYITDGRTRKIVKALNSSAQKEVDILNNKHLFNKKFRDYIAREWLYVPESSDDEIINFLKENTKLIAKPDDKMGGEGVHIINCREVLSNPDSFLKKAKGEGLLLEQVIKQHPLMSEINQSSVNTIRVCSVRDRNGEVKIFAASLRGGGADSLVDNLHAGGAQYPLDVRTGIISRGGVKFDGERDILFHPSSNYKMIGFQVPNWSAVIDTVSSAAKLPEDLRYIGWDVVITDRGCELLEGNAIQGCNGMQQDGVGKYDLVKKYY